MEDVFLPSPSGVAPLVYADRGAFFVQYNCPIPRSKTIQTWQLDERSPTPQHMLRSYDGLIYPLHAEAHSSFLAIFMSPTGRYLVFLTVHMSNYCPSHVSSWMPRRGNFSSRRKMGLMWGLMWGLSSIQRKRHRRLIKRPWTSLPLRYSSCSSTALSAFAMALTSLWDYIFIRTSICLLHLVAPLSIFYSLARWLTYPLFHLPLILEIWLALEAVFYLVIYLPLSLHLQAATAHPTPVCRSDRRKLFRRCRDNVPDPERYLTKWFRDAPTAEIKRENVKDFFRWAFLNTGDPGPEHDEELEEYASELEKMLGRKLEPGRGNAKCLRLTLDKVEMLHRSLTWYLVIK